MRHRAWIAPRRGDFPARPWDRSPAMEGRAWLSAKRCAAPPQSRDRVRSVTGPRCRPSGRCREELARPSARRRAGPPAPLSCLRRGRAPQARHGGLGLALHVRRRREEQKVRLERHRRRHEGPRVRLEHRRRRREGPKARLERRRPRPRCRGPLRCHPRPAGRPGEGMPARPTRQPPPGRPTPVSWRCAWVASVYPSAVAGRMIGAEPPAAAGS